MEKPIVLALSLILSFSAFGSNAVSSSFYPELRVNDIDYQYNFLTKIWSHKKNKDELEHYLNPYALVVDKSIAKMYLYFFNGDTKLLKTYDVVTGKVPGNKLEQGDLKTPEGIYFFDEYKSDLPAKFGGRAIPFGFPNPVDKIENRHGYGIWLHGVDTNERVAKKFDTEGCVAAANEDLVNVLTFIQTQTTPIIILDRFDNPDTFSLSPQQDVLDFVNQWRNAWVGKDIGKYMSAYADGFIDADTGKDKNAWKEHKSFLNQKYKQISVELKNISIYHHSRYWLAHFVQEYRSSGYQGKGLKRLYIIKVNNEYKILSEEFVPISRSRYLGSLINTASSPTKQFSSL
jgi:murein L,D-transpeptidase YafK